MATGMRIIKPARIHEYSADHVRAKAPLEDWLLKTMAAEWQSLADIRQTFAHADMVEVSSGRKVVIFNIGGNNFRLVTAIHFNRQTVFVLRFLTHAQYDKDRWKDEL